MQIHRVLPVRLVIAVSLCGLVFAACGGGSSSPSGGSPGSGTPSTSATAGGKPAVDLTFSGTVAVRAKGSAGTCMIGRSSADGSNVFAFQAGDADYAGLGQSFALDESAGTHRWFVKWAIRQGSAFFGYLDTGVMVASDHKSVSINADLPPSGDQTEHLTGTISCP